MRDHTNKKRVLGGTQHSRLYDPIIALNWYCAEAMGGGRRRAVENPKVHLLCIRLNWTANELGRVHKRKWIERNRAASEVSRS